MTRRQIISFAVAVAVAVGVFVSCSKTREASSEKMPPAPAEYKVKLETTKGDIVILVHRDWSPLAADRFYQLVRQGYYNDNSFFRIVKGFVVQFGMNGNPVINKEWTGKTFPDDPPKVSNKTGSVVFAKSGAPNSRSTQIFINIGDNSGSLDPQGFTPFGEVIQGLDLAMSLYNGYGDGPPGGAGPDQGEIGEKGNPYLKEHFPKLDYIQKAEVIP